MNSSDPALSTSSTPTLFPQLFNLTSVPSVTSIPSVTSVPSTAGVPITTGVPGMGSSSPSSLPSGAHDPGVTIVVVLGLSAALAVVAAFLAVCRRSGRERGTEGGRGPGESLASGPSASGEPQLKVWRRLGSYRRSYNMSFRRPPQRRPERCAPPRAVQADPTLDLHLTMPCLFDYVTEI